MFLGIFDLRPRAQMKLSSYLILALIPLLALPVPGRAAVSDDVKEIRIRSTWAGLSRESPLVTELLLTPAEDGFSMTGSNSRAGDTTNLKRTVVPAEHVSELIAALELSPQPVLKLADLGISDSEIQEQIDGAVGRYEELKESSESAFALQDYRDSLRAEATLAMALTEGFRSFHTDDYPGVRIEAMFDDGSTLVVGSNSQQFLMLPWQRGEEKTYSASIAIALMKILPDGATNRERLQGPIREWGLRELVSSSMYDELSRLKSEAQAAPALRALESAFEVRNARAQDAVPAIELGPVLFAKLRLPSGVPNLWMFVRLPLNHGVLVDPEGDLNRIRGAMSVVQASPGMVALMKSHPKEDFAVNDGFGFHWLSERAKDQFVAQMAELGRFPELASSPELMRSAVLVTSGPDPDEWIVLPDGRAIHWKRFTDEPASEGTMRCDMTPVGEEEEDLWEKKPNLCFGQLVPEP